MQPTLATHSASSYSQSFEAQNTESLYSGLATSVIVSSAGAVIADSQQPTQVHSEDDSIDDRVLRAGQKRMYTLSQTDHKCSAEKERVVGGEQTVASSPGVEVRVHRSISTIVTIVFTGGGEV